MLHNTFRLPDSAIRLIHQLAADNDGIQFALGDVASELVDELCATGDIPKTVIRTAIAKEYGCGTETIRDRERVARLVPLDLRVKYPVLLFHQWRAICSVHDKALIETYARRAVEGGDRQGGRPWTVAQIRREIRADSNGTPAWVGRYERMLGIAHLLADDEDAPPGIRLTARVVGMGLLTLPHKIHSRELIP